MKQIIAKNRAQAQKFVMEGNKNSQRVAYWKEGGTAFRFERLPGMSPTWKEDVGGLWWSATQTVAQKLGISPVSSAAATLGRKGGSVKSDRKAASSRENGKRGGRPRTKKSIVG